MLNRVRLVSKLIALAAIFFLISSTLDNIPDCPEILSSSSGTSVTVYVVHHATASLDTVNVVAGPVLPTQFDNRLWADQAPLALLSSVARCVHQCADLSPPIV